MKTTTLQEIKDKHPYEDSWEKLLKNLGKTKADNETLTFKEILDSNGIDDAVWTLRVLSFKEQCLFRADVAESILPRFEDEYPNDKRPRLAIKAIRDYYNDNISISELNSAVDAAATFGVYVEVAYSVYSATYSDTWKKIEEIFIKHFC